MAQPSCIIFVRCRRARRAGLARHRRNCSRRRTRSPRTTSSTRNRTCRHRSGCGSNSGRNRCGSLPRRRSSATAPARRAGCSSAAATGPAVLAQRRGDRKSAQPDPERRGQWGIDRGRRAVRDVALASAAVSRRGAGRLDRTAGRACRTSSPRCSTRICSISTKDGCMCWASASPAAWCCAPDREAAGTFRNCPVMIAGMRAADEISAGPGRPANPHRFRSRPLE